MIFQKNRSPMGLYKVGTKYISMDKNTPAIRSDSSAMILKTICLWESSHKNTLSWQELLNILDTEERKAKVIINIMKERGIITAKDDSLDGKQYSLNRENEFVKEWEFFLKKERT